MFSKIRGIGLYQSIRVNMALSSWLIKQQVARLEASMYTATSSQTAGFRSALIAILYEGSDIRQMRNAAVSKRVGLILRASGFVLAQGHLFEALCTASPSFHASAAGNLLLKMYNALVKPIDSHSSSWPAFGISRCEVTSLSREQLSQSSLGTACDFWT